MRTPLLIGATLGLFGRSIPQASAQFDNAPTSFYDFYRIVGGKMVEHWDVLEPLVPREQSKNPNGKF